MQEWYQIKANLTLTLTLIHVQVYMCLQHL